MLFFTASDLTSTTRHIRNGALFSLWPSHFILSGAISLLFPSSILDTYWPGEFIFQCPIFLPFHTVHRVLKARTLKWFAIPFSVDHVLSELSTMTCSFWATLHSMVHTLTESRKAVIPVIILVSFCDSVFLHGSCAIIVLPSPVCPLMDEDQRSVWASRWEALALGKTGSCSGGQDPD